MKKKNRVFLGVGKTFSREGLEGEALLLASCHSGHTAVMVSD